MSNWTIPQRIPSIIPNWLGVLIVILLYYFHFTSWFILMLIVFPALVNFGLYHFHRYHEAKNTPVRESLRPLQPKVFSGDDIPFLNPANGELLGSERAATPDEVEEVVKNSVTAQRVWGQSNFTERRQVLSDLLEYVLANQEEICRYSVLDSGKTMMEAYYGEILTTCEKLRWIIANGEDALETEHRLPPLLMLVKTARVEYLPLGVIGIIIPWNYPFHNVISGVAAALMSGNGVVVKVSEHASYSRARYQQMFTEVLCRRGFSQSLVQLIPGYGATGAALCTSPGISKILFIGSPATGKHVMRAASAVLTPVVLELGGKDPFIVLEDADLEHAVELALRGVFINQGQNCLAAERIYVHSKVYNKFCEAIVPRVKSLRQGCPCTTMRAKDESAVVDCGAMTMPRQVEIVEELVNDAVNNGARLAAGGKRGGQPGSYFFEPTVLVDVKQHMRVVQEEAFGPVMLIMSFDSDEEVVDFANGTAYGLGCSIFSSNYERAERIGKQIVSGMCTINDFGLSYLIQAVPFGGVKMSGFGRFNGVEGLREFSRQRTVVSDRFPFVTKPPRFTKYPVPAEGPEIVHNAMIAVYGSKLAERFTAAIKLLGLLRK